MLQTLLWRRMTCSSTFLKYLSAVLVQTPATYILLYCNASSTAFSAERCFQFRKKVLGLWATLYRSSDRIVQHLCLWPENAHERQLCEEFAPHPGGTNDKDAHVCEPICINMYCRANIIIKKKIPIHWRKEWQKFQSCKFIHGQYFYDNFILHCDVIRFTGMVIIVVRPPWVRCEFLAELPLVLIL